MWQGLGESNSYLKAPMPWEKMIKGYPESFVLKGPFQLTGRRQDPSRDMGCRISGCPQTVIPKAAWAEAWWGPNGPPLKRPTFHPSSPGKSVIYSFPFSLLGSMNTTENGKRNPNRKYWITYGVNPWDAKAVGKVPNGEVFGRSGWLSAIWPRGGARGVTAGDGMLLGGQECFFNLHYSWHREK